MSYYYKFEIEGMSADESKDLDNDLTPFQRSKNNSQINSNSGNPKICQCKKSKCLKMYCDCYVSGNKCSDSCKCINCQNNDENEHRKHKLMQEESLVDYSRKAKGQKTCNCKKSWCLKKYCECFHAGQKWMQKHLPQRRNFFTERSSEPSEGREVIEIRTVRAQAAGAHEHRSCRTQLEFVGFCVLFALLTYHQFVISKCRLSWSEGPVLIRSSCGITVNLIDFGARNVIFFIAGMERRNLRKFEDHRQDAVASKAYIETIKHFLQTTKTEPCELRHEHDLNICRFYHQGDQRRNPYLNNSFAYFPDAQSFAQSSQSEQDHQVMLCQNEQEYIYHPLVYKTQRCSNFYNCELDLVCPNLHLEDQKAFEYGQFFRFDINTHKTKLCPRRENHERKTCVYYHTEMDRRRPHFKQYSYEMCAKKGCKDDQCGYSHNKIEQVYHPVRYKTKFCKSYAKKTNNCEYKEFCGFAHTQAEIKVEMIHLLEPNHDFYLSKYKTVWCPDTLWHERSNCVYAHNIQDFRRDPFSPPFYDSEKCGNWNFEEELKAIEDSGCKDGMQCTHCHGWMEQRYHPQVFKRNKFNESKDINSLLDKKLSNPHKEAKEKQGPVKRISSVIEERIVKVNTSIYSGAPFFKKEASESSRPSKAITTNIESDDSGNRDEQPCNPRVRQNIRKNSMFIFSEWQMWRQKESSDSQFQKKNEERARSENKFDQCETVYSHSLKETFANNSLLKKLKENNLNELKIKNLNEKSIEEFRFLDHKEKEELNNKVRIYQLRREKNPVIYSSELAKFFINKKHGLILEKTRVKKIKEEQLLKMRKKQIKQLDFLSPAEREQLPRLIDEFRKFCTDKEFSQINEEINRLVTPKTQDL